MNRFGKSVASAVCAAQIVGGCSTSPVDQKPAEATLPTTTVQSGESWTSGARPLSKVTVHVSVSGDKDRVLSSDGQGFLVIREDTPAANGREAAPAARLVYQNDRPGIYELPSGVYSVQMIAETYSCLPASFRVPAPEGELPALVLSIDISVTGDEAKMTMMRPGAFATGAATSGGYPAIENDRSIRWCGPGHASRQSDDPNKGAKTALAVVGLIVLFPIAVLMGASNLGTFKTK